MPLANDTKSSPSYGFYDRLRSEFPSQVVADTTEICNLACVHCSHPEFKKSEHYNARLLNVELNNKMVDEVRDHGAGITQYIRYSGNGEPLLNRQLFTMLKYATAYSGTTVTLTTNGTLLNEARIEHLLETGVNLIDISIDAFTPETYASIRVNGSLDIVRDNVTRLIHRASVQATGTKVVVSFIEQPQNAAEIPSFERYWRDQGASQVVIRRLHTNANSTTRLAHLKGENSMASRRPCLYPWERILITPTGNLAFCPQDWTHASALADYRQTTIRETWKSDVYRQLREAHLANNFCKHEFCGQCSDWATTRWPGSGLSYADLVAGISNLSTDGKNLKA